MKLPQRTYKIYLAQPSEDIEIGTVQHNPATNTTTIAIEGKPPTTHASIISAIESLKQQMPDAYIDD